MLISSALLPLAHSSTLLWMAGGRVPDKSVGVWKCVDSMCRPIEFALSVETNEILPRKADSLDIAGPNEPVFADVVHNLLKRHLFQYVIT
jgi:hypothetical protein